MNNIKLRPYQQECIDRINKQKGGKHLIVMATALGKTVTFANIEKKGRTLILSHREELVTQPKKYYKETFGIELNKNHSKDTDEIVSASVQTLVKRLNNFSPDAFDTIIVDEAHHAAAKSYKQILNYFKPRLVLGFTATPNRSDNVRLDDVFDDIIFERNLKWGIKEGYLSDIKCKRVKIGYSLENIGKNMGDFIPNQLEDAMKHTPAAIADVYKRYAKGATLIFAVNIEQAEKIAQMIPGGAVAVTAQTKNREVIIDKFTKGEIPCIVNCMVFSEGTDLPFVETIIMARPTTSNTLYAQMVGRGLRKHPNKTYLNLIDCVDNTERNDLCTAPSLLGIDISEIPARNRNALEGNLLDMPEKAKRLHDTPEAWIQNEEIVDLWAKEQAYNLHNIRFFRHPDGVLTISLKNSRIIKIPCPDALGQVNGKPYQQIIDEVYIMLRRDHANEKQLWDNSIVSSTWGNDKASPKQIACIKKLYPAINANIMDRLTKAQASNIISRLNNK